MTVHVTIIIKSTARRCRSLMTVQRNNYHLLCRILHQCILRGRAVARPSCVYTVIIVDRDDDDGNDVALHSFFEILDIWSHFGLEFRVLTPDRAEFIGKTSIFGLDTTTNR